MRKAKGEGLRPHSRPLTRFSKYGAKKQAQRNVEIFFDHFVDLQHNGNHLEALDLSREILGAAVDRRALLES